jgi:hypothetical protein
MLKAMMLVTIFIAALRSDRLVRCPDVFTATVAHVMPLMAADTPFVLSAPQSDY